MHVRKLLLGALLAVAAWGVAAVAEAVALPAPKGRTILTVSGKISSTNKGDTAEFDRDMLEAMGTESFTTETPWYPGAVKFEGVSLNKLMQQVGAKGQTLSVVALNDYSSEIPFEDFQKFNVILALKQNGEYMSVRDKGPIFIMYPFDSDPVLKHQTYYGRAVWQVAKIVVK